MSSSRIFKSGSPEQNSVSDYGFESLGDRPLPASPDLRSADGFVPLMQTGGRGAYDPDAGECAAGDESSGGAMAATKGKPVVLSEEEFNERLTAAFTEGVREGSRQAEEILASKCRALVDALDSITFLREKILRESEEDLLRLSLMVARKIIQQEISVDRQIVANIVAAAVSSVAERDEIVIRLNPEDYQVVAEHKKIHLPGREEKRLTLKADVTIPCGGCMVDTALGAIDATIETQLEEICRCLLDKREASFQKPAEEGEAHDLEEV